MKRSLMFKPGGGWEELDEVDDRFLYRGERSVDEGTSREEQWRAIAPIEASVVVLCRLAKVGEPQSGLAEVQPPLLANLLRLSRHRSLDSPSRLPRYRSLGNASLLRLLCLYRLSLMPRLLGLDKALFQVSGVASHATWGVTDCTEQSLIGCEKCMDSAEANDDEACYLPSEHKSALAIASHVFLLGRNESMVAKLGNLPGAVVARLMHLSRQSAFRCYALVSKHEHKYDIPSPLLGIVIQLGWDSIIKGHRWEFSLIRDEDDPSSIKVNLGVIISGDFLHAEPIAFVIALVKVPSSRVFFYINVPIGGPSSGTSCYGSENSTRIVFRDHCGGISETGKGCLFFLFPCLLLPKLYLHRFAPAQRLRRWTA
ncbi:hypothetical protein Pfo_020440 [Paulownia fortunei]|nr:hypothetical protein Pfo_020440 [Paulownia fortunei]